MNHADDNGLPAEAAKPRTARYWGWMLFPVSLFPFAALMTYDWQSVGFLQTPAADSSNWIGFLGDAFAYYGYLFFGLAVWIVPVFCAMIGLRLAFGGCCDGRGRRRFAWRAAILVSASCLLQAMQSHAPGIEAAMKKFNIMAAGGAAGYLVMGKCLAPLLSDIGASVLMLAVLAVSICGSIGASNIASFFGGMFRWAAGGDADGKAGGEDDAAYEAARIAREESKRRKEEEKRRKEEIKREREEAAARAKEEKRAAKEAAKAAARAAKTGAAEKPAEQPAAAREEERTVEPEEAEGSGEKAPEPYVLPPVDLLDPLKKSSADHGDVGAMSKKLVDTLKLFNISAEVSYTVEGPVVTKYALLLEPGTRYSAVTNIADNLKGALHAKSLRIEAPIPGEECVGVEVPNRNPAGISFREIFESEAWKNTKAEIPLLFGKDAAGKELIADLASMPHMLVAGATGQGKSVCLNSLICGLLMTRTPEELKLMMVDPKSVEFTPYSSIPHLLVPVITDNKKVVYSLHWAVVEMEKRLKLFSRAKVRNIYDFNHRKKATQMEMFGEDTEVGSEMPRTVPYIVIIIDEVADLMSTNGKEVTPDISRLTAKARAAGIHLILATQRPDAKIITGTIKSNIPGRVAFKTAQAIDSRTILDDSGAENLIGRGDMLFKGKDGNLVRAQGAWISDGEIANITAFIEEHSKPQFDETFAKKLSRVKEAAIEDPFASNEDDPDNQTAAPSAEDKAAQRMQVKAAADADDFKKAVECVINTRRASTSHFQRQLGWGYNHAAKILDMLTERGIVSAPQGMGPRQIVMDQDQLVAILNGGGADAVAANGEDGAADPSAEEPAAGGENFETTEAET